ncbi:equilibrative nucleoside transporter 4 isoform X8 [Sagmatias obliquidens]|uniref:equilibrative nucleoside transporter 4 isoform X8 n=1 Tax=Sagmatias obliquidens TaxID=3371155 RepID=UPI000F441BB9|nr:equilibrative nucleoside transporter 4 isoform X8 [Lagenorhynchus obliquidens]
MVRGTLEHGAGTQVFRIFLPPSLSLRCARCCRPHAGLQPCSPLQPGSIGRHKSRDVARPFRRAAMGSVGSQHLQEPSVASTPHRSVVMSFDSGPLEEVAAGVAQAQGSRARGIPIFTDSEEPVPDDRYRAVYFATLLAGVGFLLPYNSFITDVDYLHHKYPGTSIVFDMSLTYILVALVAVLLNNALVERLSLHTRITAGTPPLPTRLPALTPGRHMPSIPCVRLTLLVCYLLALGPLLFISICDVWLQLFSRDQAYAINLAAVGTVAFGCTAIQLLRVHGDAAQEVHAGGDDGGDTGAAPPSAQPQALRSTSSRCPQSSFRAWMGQAQPCCGAGLRHGGRDGLPEPYPHEAAATRRAGRHAHLLPGLRGPGAALLPAAPAGAGQPLRALPHGAAPPQPHGRLPRAPRRGRRGRALCKSRGPRREPGGPARPPPRPSRAPPAAPRCRCRLRLQLLLWPEAPTHGPSFVLWTKVSSLGDTTHLRPEAPWL